MRIVNLIYNWFIDESMNEFDIAARLNSMNVRTDSDRDWTRATVREVLTNEKYIGNNITSERILRKMNDEKKMNMNVISGKDYGESFLTLQSGRVQAFMMDDVLLAGARTLAQKPADWVVTGTPQSFEAYGFMLRKEDPQFKKLVDDTLTGIMKRGEINTLYASPNDTPFE